MRELRLYTPAGHTQRFMRVHSSIELTYDCLNCEWLMTKLTGNMKYKKPLTERQFIHWMLNKDLVVEMLRLELCDL